MPIYIYIHIVEISENSNFFIFLASELAYQLESVIQGNQAWMPNMFRVHSLLSKVTEVFLSNTELNSCERRRENSENGSPWSVCFFISLYEPVKLNSIFAL